MTEQEIKVHFAEKYLIEIDDSDLVLLSAPSEPAETGRADEKAIAVLLSIIPNDCVWGEMDRLTNTPIRFVTKAMTTYADQRCADRDMFIQRLHDAAKDKEEYITWAKSELEAKDREIAELKLGKGIAESDRIFFKDRRDDVLDRVDQLQSELTKSNAHRSRLIESLKKWGGAWRKCRAELKEARKEIAELKGHYIELDGFSHATIGRLTLALKDLSEANKRISELEYLLEICKELDNKVSKL